jgi:hypothetical protein
MKFSRAISRVKWLIILSRRESNKSHFTNRCLFNDLKYTIIDHSLLSVTQAW